TTTEQVATEEAKVEPRVAAVAQIEAVTTKPKQIQIPKRVIRRLTKLSDRLDAIEDMLRPLKSIEKGRSSIKDMQKQLKVIARHVTRIDKSVNKLIGKGVGRRGRKGRGRRVVKGGRGGRGRKKE
ncbi:MAG: hypothetical protein QXS82_05305, partial [Candidatus Nitrosocaldus sp.]